MQKLKIFRYSKNFSRLFEKKKKEISAVLKNAEVYHIGSTAVRGLGGKGIIDMMIALDNWGSEKEIIKKLRNLGFSHVHPREKGKIFLSTRKATSCGDFHLHLTRKQSKPYRQFLSFRDYLRRHPREVKRFFNLKLKWREESQNDRRRYNEIKGKYVEEILKRVKSV